ncbi:MAG: ubiquitin carboxyl-terminal hydrolase 14 [Vicinamibacterales bacterium]
MTCTHMTAINPMPARTSGCEECLKQGAAWVHLRVCLSCGHVGCCDSSPNRHATAHFHQTAHPVMASFEPGERWAWCYVDQIQQSVPAGAKPYLR